MADATSSTTPPAPAPLESHLTHSQRLMEHAEEQLAKGDRLQASEKAWGAVAHQIKAIANRRGWKYDAHSQVYDLVRRLAEETEDPILVRDLFSTANGLHRNYYADAMPLEQLGYELSRVKSLLRILSRPELMRPPRQRRRSQPDRTFRRRRRGF